MPRGIAQVDQQLSEWVKQVAPAAVVSLGPPGDGGDEQAVGLYLMEVADRSPSIADRTAPLRLELRYLVTTSAAKPEEAHDLLGGLAQAALESADLEVELQPVGPETWRAFQVAPRPSILLKVPLLLERGKPAHPVELVRHPLVLDARQPGPLDGHVLGPDDVPLPGALVTIPVVDLSTRTDAHGAFHFAAVSPQPTKKKLTVIAKGHRRTVEVGGDTPIVIRFKELEG